MQEFVESTNRRFERLEADVAEIKTDIAESKADIHRIDDQLGRLRGDMLELKLARGRSVPRSPRGCSCVGPASSTAT